MAQKRIVELVDDVDGSRAGETVAFSLDGVQYEIDLNDENAAKLRSALKPYIGAGRRVGGRKAAPDGRRGGSPGSNAAPDPKAVRAWAQSNNIEVPARGRIPEAVVLRFQEAGN